jgi:outer membrane receptor for ferrienterochelin and colicin
MLLSAATVLAQLTVSGRITDGGGKAIVGASIKLSDGQNVKGAYSDSRGRYAVKGVAEGSYTMTVTCVGYQKSVTENVAVSASETTTMDVSLAETAIDMDVTVVTASRTQQKASEAPASVTVVEPRTIREAPKNTPVEHLRGLSGVDFSQTGIAQQNVSVRGFNNVFSGWILRTCIQ